MKKKHYIWIVAYLLFLMTSCEKKFDPNDAYKDITIVYGLINPVDSIHYIRIHKAFLTTDNVVVMAQDPTQSTYPVEDLDVRIYEITPTGNTTQIPVETTIIHDKDSGIFYYQEQLVYYFKKTFQNLYNLDNTIKIEIENKKTGKIVYAETPLVNDFEVTVPRHGMRLNFDPEPTAMKFEWNNAKNGRIYDFYYTLRYREGRTEDPSSVWKRDSMVWHMGLRTATTTGDGSEKSVIFTFNSLSFYDAVKGAIAYDANVWRRPYIQVKLTIWCGSEDMYHYNYINGNPRPTPDIPEYTNLRTRLGTKELENESYGIFSSRIVKNITIYISEQMAVQYLPNKVLVNRQFLPKPVVED